jgi:hypothetical protein
MPGNCRQKDIILGAFIAPLQYLFEKGQGIKITPALWRNKPAVVG